MIFKILVIGAIFLLFAALLFWFAGKLVSPKPHPLQPGVDEMTLGELRTAKATLQSKKALIRNAKEMIEIGKQIDVIDAEIDKLNNPSA